MPRITGIGKIRGKERENATQEDKRRGFLRPKTSIIVEGC